MKQQCTVPRILANFLGHPVEALISGIGACSYVFRDDNQATALLDNNVISPALEQCNRKEST